MSKLTPLQQEFHADYTQTMLELEIFTPVKVATAAKLFLGPLFQIRSNNVVLKKLQEYLDIWWNSKKPEDQLKFSPVYVHITNRLMRAKEDLAKPIS